MEYIKSKIRDVVDFPSKGVLFKDLTTAFKDPRALHIIGWDLSQMYRDKGVTKVVGIESRGFIGGSILAYEIGAGFVPARKPGKLPRATYAATYELEYGSDALEIHQDALTPDDVVLIVDDLVATGGTVRAVVKMIEGTGATLAGMGFFLELAFLNPREVIAEATDAEVFSLHAVN